MQNLLKQFGIVILLCVMANTKTQGQEKITASGITFTYQIIEERLKCSLEAPTNGWIGVGFNTKNAIVGSDLLLFNIIDQQVSSTDLYVKGVGNPVRDIKNGGRNSIVIKEGKERQGYTKVHFSIPLISGDPNDFEHSLGQKAWLILAYSTDDDFEHHSRVRRHIPFTLKSK